MRQEQRKILFSGHVQSVGFRMTTVHLARDLNLSGTVRNLPYGGVELVAQGSAKALDLLIERIREHFGAFIRSMQQDVLATGAEQPTDGSDRGIRIIS